VRMNKKKKIVPKLRFSEFKENSWESIELGKISEAVKDKAGDNKYILMIVTAGT